MTREGDADGYVFGSVGFSVIKREGGQSKFICCDGVLANDLCIHDCAIS